MTGRTVTTSEVMLALLEFDKGLVGQPANIGGRGQAMRRALEAVERSRNASAVPAKQPRQRAEASP